MNIYHNHFSRFFVYLLLQSQTIQQRWVTRFLLHQLTFASVHCSCWSEVASPTMCRCWKVLVSIGIAKGGPGPLPFRPGLVMRFIQNRWVGGGGGRGRIRSNRMQESSKRLRWRPYLLVKSFGLKMSMCPIILESLLHHYWLAYHSNNNILSDTQHHMLILKCTAVDLNCLLK